MNELTEQVGGQALAEGAAGTNQAAPLISPPPDPLPANTTSRRGGDWIERTAKLFEAGEYPDKGVTITIEDLSTLADGFGEAVPVLIEHAESPLELGYLTAVRAMGDELFGTVALTPEANSLAERSGARALSLGLTPDLMAIREVSLVRNPRVETARLFDGSPSVPVPGPVFHGLLEAWETAPLEGEELARAAGEVFATDPEPLPHPPAPSPRTQHRGEGVNWRERYERLATAQEEKEAERAVREFIAAGKLCPSQAPMAKALLLSGDTVTFDGKSRPLRQVAREMIERQPRLGLFSEIAPEPAGDEASHLLLPEEAEFYRRHFPDVSLAEIAKAGKGAGR